MGRRTKARECAFQMLYQWDLTRATFEQIANHYWKLRTTADDTQHRAEELCRGALGRVDELDAAIVSVAKNWRLDRMAAVDRSILRLAAYELLAEPHTPGAVVIDEAVELAKRFGAGDSSSFVNGVLDAIRKSTATTKAKPAKAPRRAAPRGSDGAR